jgi:predicted amino acid racemase
VRACIFSEGINIRKLLHNGTSNVHISFLHNSKVIRQHSYDFVLFVLVCPVIIEICYVFSCLNIVTHFTSSVVPKLSSIFMMN